MKPHGSTVPHPPPEYEYLVASDSHNYVHRYAAHRQSAAKIRELERELATGRAPPETLQHVNKLKREVASANRGKGFEPPESVVFDLGPYKDRATGRILVARRTGPDALRYYAYRSKEDLISDVVGSLIWDDPQARNVPYSPLCVYPMTEEGVPCGLYIDAEEEFESPREAYDVPTDEQLVTPAECELNEEDEGYGTSDPLELSILRNEKRRLLVQRARHRFERGWRDRENEFALRCRWILVLVKQSISSMFGIDLSESPVWWFTACSRFKNSFRIYVPDWVFVNVEQLHAVMSNALAMLNLMPLDHPCRAALRLGPGTVQRERNPYIIDWSVYNKHRQMRAPFQPKDPTKRNAFVPYDGTVLGRIPTPTRRAAALAFEPALCVAFDRSQRTLFSCLPHALPFELGDPRTTDQLAMAVRGCVKAIEQHRHTMFERMRVSVVLSALIATHKRCRGVSARSALETNRLEGLRAFVTDHNDWVLELAVPTGAARRIHTPSIPLLLEAFVWIFTVQTMRYVYSWRDDRTERFIPGGRTSPISFPQDDRLTPAMRFVFVRTFIYHTIFARVALDRNRHAVLHEDLRAPNVPLEETLTLHRRNLIMIHAMQGVQALSVRVSSGSKGSLTPFEPGLVNRTDLDTIWTPTDAEKAANSPFTKARALESVWPAVEGRYRLEEKQQQPVRAENGDREVEEERKRGAASCVGPSQAPQDFPPQKRRAVQDKLSQHGARVTSLPAAHGGASVGLVARRAHVNASALYAFQPASGGDSCGEGTAGVATQDAAY